MVGIELNQCERIARVLEAHIQYVWLLITFNFFPLHYISIHISENTLPTYTSVWRHTHPGERSLVLCV